ncbi:hypothetical protein ACETU7_24815 [Rhodococcus sp. 3Y1]
MVREEVVELDQQGVVCRDDADDAVGTEIETCSDRSNGVPVLLGGPPLTLTRTAASPQSAT